MSKIKYFIKHTGWQILESIFTYKQVRDVKSKYNQLPNKKKLTREQRKDVIDFYKKLTGIKVPLIWHEYYYSKTGQFAKEVLPDSLYRQNLIGRANRFNYRDAYADKNMIDVYLSGTRIPKPILKNLNGYFYMDGEPVTREDAIARLKNIDLAIIKPTLESHGDGVRKLRVTDGVTNIDGKTLDQLFRDSYKDKNFIIQEWVEQHDVLAALNPSSLNTIRIVTFRMDLEILVLFSSIRIGREGCEIDNIGAGGLSVAVNPDGTLGRYGYLSGKENRREKTDSGVTLDGYQLPSFDKVLEFVKKLHYRLPFFDMIGWDVSINKSNEPVLIEWNVRTELSQLSYGPAFGKNTERIIKKLWPRENTRNPFWK